MTPPWPRLRVAALAAGLLALAGAAAVIAEEPRPAAQPPPRTFSESVSVDYVLVPVTVRSKKGPVTDLARERFRLWVDGCPVAFESFDSGSEQALGVVILQDLSGSMAIGGRLAASRAALDYFLASARPTDRFAVATFAGRSVDVELAATADRGAVRRTMAAWRGYGVTALYDAVARLPELRAAAGGARSAVVLVTDGAENASRTEPEAARKAARRADLPVYVLDVGTVAGGPVPSPAELVRLAEGTGGRYHRAGGPAELELAIREIVEDLRAHYVLGFSTVAGGEVRTRPVRLEIAGRELWISHRRVYEGRAPRCAAGAVRR